MEPLKASPLIDIYQAMPLIKLGGLFVLRPHRPAVCVIQVQSAVAFPVTFAPPLLASLLPNTCVSIVSGPSTRKTSAASGGRCLRTVQA